MFYSLFIGLAYAYYNCNLKYNENLIQPTISLEMSVPSQSHYVLTVFRWLTDFVCLYTYEFWLSLCKIVRSSEFGNFVITLIHNSPHTRTNMWHPKHTVMALTYINIALLAIPWNTTDMIHYDQKNGIQ